MCAGTLIHSYIIKLTVRCWDVGGGNASDSYDKVYTGVGRRRRKNSIKYKIQHKTYVYDINGRQTFLPLVGVNVFRGHKLAYERGLAHSRGSQQGHVVRFDVAIVLPVPVLMVPIVVTRHGRGAFLGIVFLSQAVAPGPASPERIAPVDYTCARNRDV